MLIKCIFDSYRTLKEKIYYKIFSKKKKKQVDLFANAFKIII